MKKINYGRLDGDTYVKYIDYNKAVLWKTRQISLHEKVKQLFDSVKFKTIRFVDEKKKKMWEVDAQKAFNHAEHKKVGQEPQYYFTIAILEEKDLNG
jgi:hypothetical protein